jgi:hypothetical protein
MMGLVPTQARIYHVVPCSCRVKIVVFRAGLYSPVRLATYSRDEEMPFKQPPQSNPSLFESNVPKSATGSSSRFAPAAFHRNAAQQHRVQLAGTQNQGPARSRLQLLTVSAPFSRAEMFACGPVIHPAWPPRRRSDLLFYYPGQPYSSWRINRTTPRRPGAGGEGRGRRRMPSLLSAGKIQKVQRTGKKIKVERKFKKSNRPPWGSNPRPQG